MPIKEKLNNLFRKNVASIHTYESIKSNAHELKYQDNLVKGTYHDFWDYYSRKEVALNDAVGNRVTMGFMKHIFQKLPKFCPNDEVQTEYIMDDVRQALELLNIKGKFILIGTNLIINGWNLVQWHPFFAKDKLTSLNCTILGYEECHPRYWFRFHKPGLANKIYKYQAIYIPRPLGMEAIDQTLAEERKYLDPTDPTFQHLTRVDYNYGYGYSRLQPIWDAITKLREVSNDEHFLKSLFMEVRYPQSWHATKKAQDYVDKTRKATRRRGLATEAVINPQTNEDTGLPSVQFRPWGQGPQGQRVDVNQASAYLDGEWLRLLVNLGYSQVWATGSNAGALEGSEINLTRDDRADIAEFSILEPVFKKVLEKLTQLGIMAALGVSEESQQLLLSKKYRMVCWLTWEYNDKAALQQEQLQNEMEMKRGSTDDRNAYDRNNTNHNIMVTERLLTAMRLNFSMPMTPVKSSWIKKIGYDEGSLYMQVHGRTKKGIDTYEYNPASEEEIAGLYEDWVASGSKGRFWWDRITDLYSPAFKHGRPPDYLETGYGEDLAFADPETGREFKMKGDPQSGTIGVGTSAAPYPLPSGDISTPYQMPEAMYNPSTAQTVDQTTAEPSPYTAGYVTAPESITGTQKIGAGRKRKRGRSTTRSPIVPYNPTLYNSALITNTFESEIPKMLRLGKQVNWSMSKNTAYNFLNLVNHINSHTWRCNSIAIGNEMAFDMPLYYMNSSGGVDVEFACPEAFKEVLNHTGDLYLYPNLGHEGDRHNVGTYERIGWDNEKNKPILKLNYDEDKIKEYLLKWNKQDSNIMKRLEQGLVPEISTEYYCKPVEKDGKVIQTKIHNSKYESIYEGIAIVDYGNCNSDHCKFTLLDETIA